MERLGFRDQTGLLGRGRLCIPEAGCPVRQEVVTGKVLGDLGLHETWLHSASAVPLPTAFPWLSALSFSATKGHSCVCLRTFACVSFGTSSFTFLSPAPLVIALSGPPSLTVLLSPIIYLLGPLCFFPLGFTVVSSYVFMCLAFSFCLYFHQGKDCPFL